MDEALRATAQMIRDSMPCSIELPAGTGKTQTVAGLAVVAAERGERPLVLTHTNAGVDVLRRRLRSFGVSGSAMRVDTIASWSFELVRHYPLLSGMTVPEEPDWTRSKEYYAGAAATSRASAIRAVLQASYRLVIIDEYQDCVVEQHELIVAIGEALPVCVFGDSLQNIFNFRGNVTVRWSDDVAAHWPSVALPVEPWRWRGYNERLGEWLLDIRPSLTAGRPIDLVGAPLIWRSTVGAPRAGINACYDMTSAAGSVVAIKQFSPECAAVAAQTNGSYGMMEELQGKFMATFACTVDGGDPKLIAVATRNFAKDCISGIASKVLDSALAGKLAKGQSVANLRRLGAERQLALLSGLLIDPSPARVAETLTAIGQLETGRLYRREAWRDMIRALTVAGASEGVTVVQALNRVRDRARRNGRPREARVVSRPLLIKGLEYDHAIVLDAKRLSATELYVALSRGRKSLTVVSQSRYLSPPAADLRGRGRS
jgi:AAA domain